MKYRHDLMEPIFFTPPHNQKDGSRRLYKGGGGGSSAPSGGNDTLWNQQADKVKQDMAMSGEMFDYWRQYSPQYLANANQMTQEAMDGTLTNRMRSKAGADADQMMGQGLGAATRSLDRFGATMNPNAMAHDAKSAALAGAANKVNAMGRANEWGEGQKWARNQDAYGLSAGMPGNAVAMSSQAGSGMNSLSSMQNSQNAADGANAAGYGRMGATVANTLFKADGGLARTRRLASGGAVKLAAGGIPQSPVIGWRDRMATMPTIGRTDSKAPNPVMSMVSGALPTIGAELAKPYLDKAMAPIKDGLSNVVGQGRNMLERGLGMDQTQAPAEVIDKSTSFMDSASTIDPSAQPFADAAMGAPADIATDTAVTGLNTAAADTAGMVAADTATNALASTAMETAGSSALASAAAANAWNPAGWALMGLSAANALDLFADGGRVDMRPGGPVEGAGTETSDSIPAWLSDEEYVLNAEAVKMIGKPQLDKLNEQGLKRRHGEQARMVDGEAKPNGLAGGGMLGIAMGAGADTYSRLAQQDEETRQRKEMMGLRQAEFDMRKSDHDRAAAKEAKLTAATDDAGRIIANGAMVQPWAQSGGLSMLRNELAGRVKSGELTQGEAQAALGQYEQYSPENVAAGAGAALSSVDPAKGMQMQQMLQTQAQKDRMARLTPILASRDWAGAAKLFTDNGFNPDGNSYTFLGAERDKKDGRNYLNYQFTGKDGKSVTQRVDEEMAPAWLESAIDPTKGIEYSRMINGQRKDDARHAELIAQHKAANGNSAGHLKLAQDEAARKSGDRTEAKKLAGEAADFMAGMDQAKAGGNADAFSAYKQNYDNAVLGAKVLGYDVSLKKGDDDKYHFNVIDGEDGRKVMAAGNMRTGEVTMGGKPGLSTATVKPGAPGERVHPADSRAKGTAVVQRASDTPEAQNKKNQESGRNANGTAKDDSSAADVPLRLRYNKDQGMYDPQVENPFIGMMRGDADNQLGIPRNQRRAVTPGISGAGVYQ